MKSLVAVALMSMLSIANAEDTSFTLSPAPLLPERTNIDLSYLVDGGMIPLFWAPLAGRLAIDRWAPPRGTPMMFDASEGGAAKASWEVPTYAVSGLAVGLGVGILASGDESRWYHVKGLGQSMMVSSFVTGGLKSLFGRHRPDWSAGDTDLDQRKSFPSGHATQAFAAGTYAILYLRNHVFDSMRGDSVLPWWEAATYAGIGLTATAIASERVWHDRHHLSDVAIGGALGIASSVLFYRYQDRRFEDEKEKATLHNLKITPTVTKESTTVDLSFEW